MNFFLHLFTITFIILLLNFPVPGLSCSRVFSSCVLFVSTVRVKWYLFLSLSHRSNSAGRLFLMSLVWCSHYINSVSCCRMHVGSCNKTIVIIRLCPQVSLNSKYFLNLSTINAKLSFLRPCIKDWYICFFTSVHRYHSNNSYNDVRFGNSSR